MKNRVEQYFTEVYGSELAIPETAAPKQATPEVNDGSSSRTLTQSSIFVHNADKDFRRVASETLADVVESLHGRSIEYLQSDAPKVFDREKFVAYHANPQVWDKDHSYRAGMLELSIGASDVMPHDYDLSADIGVVSPDFDYDHAASSSLAEEPSAHIVWHFPQNRFDGYLLKKSDGELTFIVLSDTKKALETVKWLSSEVASRFGNLGYRVNTITEKKEYREEL